MEIPWSLEKWDFVCLGDDIVKSVSLIEKIVKNVDQPEGYSLGNFCSYPCGIGVCLFWEM